MIVFHRAHQRFLVIRDEFGLTGKRYSLFLVLRTSGDRITYDQTFQGIHLNPDYKKLLIIDAWENGKKLCHILSINLQLNELLKPGIRKQVKYHPKGNVCFLDFGTWDAKYRLVSLQVFP